MFLIWVTFLTAFFVEALGTLVSVKGASSFFGGNAIIVALVLALDIGKVVLVSFAYQYWKPMNLMMKLIAIPMIAVMIVFTSGSAAGFLSGEFQKGMVGNKEIAVKVEALQQEQAKLELRKRQIDDQIANLPSTATRSRVLVMRQFDAEQKRISERIAEIDRELPDLQVTKITAEAKSGPIVEMAKVFDIPVEQAVKYVILLIVFVFDPLAVFLIVAGNFMIQQRKKNKTGREEKQQLSEPQTTATPVSLVEDVVIDNAERQINPIVVAPPPESKIVDVSIEDANTSVEEVKVPKMKQKHTLAELKAQREIAPIMDSVKPDSQTQIDWNK